jgi:hypothetical protein
VAAGGCTPSADPGPAVYLPVLCNQLHLGLSSVRSWGELSRLTGSGPVGVTREDCVALKCPRC